MGARIQHVTLTADDVKEVSLNKNYQRVEVLNVDGAAAVYFTVDGSDPTVEGDDCHCIPAAIGALDAPSVRQDNPTVVKLISTGTPKVSVRGLG
jgi:hypothetical protein